MTAHPLPNPSAPPEAETASQPAAGVVHRYPIAGDGDEARDVSTLTPVRLDAEDDPVDAAERQPAQREEAEPVWCVQGHFDEDPIADRRHVGAGVMMRLSLAEAVDRGSQLPPAQRWEPAHLTLRLVQRLGDVLPTVCVYRDPELAEAWATCRVPEAVLLADLLVLAAARAEEQIPVGDPVSGAPFWLETACPEWCTTRHEPDDHYEDRMHQGDLLPDGEGVIDLLLERAVKGHPEQIDVVLAHHYRSSSGAVHLVRSERTNLQLTPPEARTLAGHLRKLVRTAQLRADPAGQKGPLGGKTRNGETLFPCPHRRHWCRGHSRNEIIEARRPGNHLMHRGPVGSIPLATGNSLGTIDVSVSGYQDQPFAYLRVVNGDRAGLDPAAIDHTIAALQRAKALILDNAAPTGTGAPRGRAG
jgi:hypothetical protein